MIELTEQQIADIRAYRAKGFPHRDIAVRMKRQGVQISPTVVGWVLSGKRKANVGPDGWELPRPPKRSSKPKCPTCGRGER